MKVGSRVLCSLGKKWKLGIIIKDHGSDKMEVVRDDGNTYTTSTRNLKICTYFASFIKGELDAEWLEKYAARIKPDDYNIRQYFLLKKAQVCTLPLLTSMWYWCNTYLFHSKLELPTLKTSCPKQSLGGLYQYRKSGDTISISARNRVTCYDIFTTLCHEVVHQYNYRQDWLVDHTFDPDAGSHGRTFQRWKPILKEIAGVNLTVTYDRNETDIDDGVKRPDKPDEPEEVTDTNVKAAPSQYILLVKFKSAGKTVYYGCKAKDEEVMKSAKKTVRGVVGMVGVYTSRKLSNVPLLNLLTSATNKSTNGAKKVGAYYFSSIPESIYLAVLKAATPLEEG